MIPLSKFKNTCFIVEIIALITAIAPLAALSQEIQFGGSNAAFIGTYVADLRNGKIVSQRNHNKNFTPASVMKCVTAASVVLTHDNAPLFTTRVELQGAVKNRVLRGNIVIRGGGDPSLESSNFPDNLGFVKFVVTTVRNAGIDSIAGRIVTDRGHYPAIGQSPSWLLEDIPWRYGAGIYGINYRDNGFRLELPAGKWNGTAEASSGVPVAEVHSQLVRGKTGDVIAMRGITSDDLYVDGTITTAKYTSQYSMPSPESVLRMDIEDALLLAGVGVGNNAMPAAGALKTAAWKSPARNDLLRTMMFKSDNLLAEGCLRLLSPATSQHTFDASTKAEKQLLKDIAADAGVANLVDGSGLSRTNRITPQFLGSILRHMADNKDYVSFFPLVGKQGTVRGLLANTRLTGRLALKSGSMNGVLCYAGYKLDTSGRPTHVVVVMVNGFSCKTTQVRAAIGKWLLAIFQ